MKAILLTILLTISLFCFSQNRNNIWLSGFVFPDHINGLDFGNGSPDTFSLSSSLVFFLTNAGICDTSGQLLFYSNGDFISNKNFERLPNSTYFNPTLTGDSTYGSNGCQSVLLIPAPEDDSLYYVFHENGETFTAHGQPEYNPLELRYSIIDQRLDSGLGDIVPNQKSLQLINDTLTWGRITACQHGNGRDWWIIVHRYHSDVYYKILLMPDSMSISQQSIGSQIEYDILGQVAFSIDGDKYAMSSTDFKVDLMDFDRCSGIFSNHRLITLYDIIGTDTLGTLGCAFSSNGRYLYVTTNLHIFQYDTWATNLDSSKVIVATWDSSFITFATTFFMLYLGPDEKIYGTTYNGTYVLHVINQPDSAGLGCNVVQHALRMPYPNSFAMPNMPNYGLGRLVGSFCDTLPNATVDIPTQLASIKLIPNPTSDKVRIEGDFKQNDIIKIEVRNFLGQLFLISHNKSLELNIGNLPNGFYFVQIYLKRGVFVTQMIKTDN